VCYGGRGAGLRNEDKNRRGALPIAQQRLYAIKTAHSRGTLCAIRKPAVTKGDRKFHDVVAFV